MHLPRNMQSRKTDMKNCKLLNVESILEKRFSNVWILVLLEKNKQEN